MLGLRVLDWPVREAGDGSGRRIDCERKKGTREREEGMHTQPGWKEAREQRKLSRR